MNKFKTHKRGNVGGFTWFVVNGENERCVGSLRISWCGSNNGSVGSPNHRPSTVRVRLTHCTGPLEQHVEEFAAGETRKSSEAMKIGRAFIRANGLRKRALALKPYWEN